MRAYAARGSHLMPKKKPAAKLMAAGPNGEMVEVEDHRFDTDAWSISLVVPDSAADDWLRSFYAECERNGWSSHGMGQMEARENSGTITVNSKPAAKPILIVTWERNRAGPLEVLARCGDEPELAPAQAREFFERVMQRSSSGPQERIYPV